MLMHLCKLLWSSNIRPHKNILISYVFYVYKWWLMMLEMLFCKFLNWESSRFNPNIVKHRFHVCLNDLGPTRTRSTEECIVVRWILWSELHGAGGVQNGWRESMWIRHFCNIWYFVPLMSLIFLDSWFWIWTLNVHTFPPFQIFGAWILNSATQVTFNYEEKYLNDILCFVCLWFYEDCLVVLFLSWTLASQLGFDLCIKLWSQNLKMN